ncbi:MAG: peptidase M16 [Alphaproteobacteria bacterium 64-6]|uniref:M16 family metallopeptidase n=1 Tax=Hyphomicrobium sp. CS1BSMeth3 TaxID=1892844 RepID=UPI000932054B|nr:pitrilysin family protein [Hyphomicrobium sp. CS1BSMeth3]MBN9259449.1 insulinase family protein [Hyphomicrobium sp.]MBN9266360.1 insulinase family protein [Hyphomicrobium sp.]OJU26482.1 MAG: peptidase M16 [Alphaproteobacteria bacterium 64-6]
MLTRAFVHVRLLIIGLAMLSLMPVTSLAQTGPRATEFTLPNGLMVVVVPDNRAPVVTHMIWYRVGAADEPPGTSGIAHFLEHLMFKATEKIGTGEFSKIVSRLGGQDNAFTAQDITAYFQRVSKDRLPKVMEMEADRMVNLKLDEKEVLTERDVILEERRSRVENNPSAILDEQMGAALYLAHPYRIPVIGWEHEMAKLSRDDAMKFYKRFYAPNNAILVVTGDVTPEEVRKLAEATYGKIPRNPNVSTVERPGEPPHRAARRIELKDPRAGRRTWHRHYIAPAYTHAAPGEAEALDLLLKILASGPTSRIYKKLVVDEHVASSAGGWYSGTARDLGKIALFAVPNDGVPFEKIEQLIDSVIADVAANGVTEAELERAKKAYLAEYIFQSDNQASLARRYGWALTVGATVKDIEEWPERLSKVTAAQVQAATRHLDILRSVTGTMLPEAPNQPPGTRS